MSWVELIITFGISVGAVVWGFNIYHQRGTWFLAGWNTMRSDFFIYDFKKSLMSCAVCSALVRIEGCPPFSKRWIFVCGSIR